jgi:hypothetical protein
MQVNLLSSSMVAKMNTSLIKLNLSKDAVQFTSDGSFTNGLPEAGTTWYDLISKKITPKGLHTKNVLAKIKPYWHSLQVDFSE